MVRHIRTMFGHVATPGIQTRLPTMASKLREKKILRSGWRGERRGGGAAAAEDEGARRDAATEEEASRKRAGERPFGLNVELVVAFRWALIHQLFKHGQPMADSKGQAVKRMEDTKGVALNPALVQDMYRGDLRLCLYAQVCSWEVY